MRRNISLGRIVEFLVDIKSNLICDFHENPIIELGGCGPLAAAAYLDDAVSKLLTMQTETESLRTQLASTKDILKDYETAFGEVEDWTEEELAGIKGIIEKHNTEDL